MGYDTIRTPAKTGRRAGLRKYLARKILEELEQIHNLTDVENPGLPRGGSFAVAVKYFCFCKYSYQCV
jgi:hypothetical protein